MQHSAVQITCVVVFCAFFAPGQGWAQNQPRTEDPSGEDQTIVSSEQARPELQATSLSVEADCSLIYAGQQTTVFHWSPASRGQRSRLDVTRFYKGWDTGQFETLAVLDRDVGSFEWSEGEPASEYLWRVLTLLNDKWYASDTARYEVPVCVGDEE